MKLLALLLLASSAFAIPPDPPTSASFSTAIAGMSIKRSYTFGTDVGRTVPDQATLTTIFDPYGIAGTTPINQEWERYQTFNSTNFVFTANSLELTATIPGGGGLFAGGINSGQIWTKETFQPNTTGSIAYAYEVRMKIPSGVGSWPASWLYAKTPGQTDGSEIDNPEFFVMTNQNQFDWTGYDHGPNVGASIWDLRANGFVWHPGTDFSAAYHNYQLLWTPDATYKYVDGLLVYAQFFTWSSASAAQLGVNLAVGSDDTVGLPGLQPNSTGEFPMKLQVDHITIWQVSPSGAQVAGSVSRTGSTTTQ